MQEQVDAGLLTPEQARVHPYSNVITRCVGASMDVVPDIYFGTLEKGDVLLLASDGLTGMLEDEQLTRILGADGGPAALGGPDGDRGQPAGRAGQHHRHRDPDRLGGQRHRRAPGGSGRRRRALLISDGSPASASSPSPLFSTRKSA